MTKVKDHHDTAAARAASCLRLSSWPLLLAFVMVCGCAHSAEDAVRIVRENVILPEQRTIDYRDPADLPPAHLPDMAPPRTVADPRPETAVWQLSLDEALQVALVNANAIRVLSGTTAVASGQTIYDAAITNTTIDQAQAAFDPTLSWNNQWSRTNTPTAVFDPVDPTRADILGVPIDAFQSTMGLTKTNVLGGQWGLNWTENPMRYPSSVSPLLAGSSSVAISPLNPETPSSLALSYTQPLLQGAGYQVNMAPIVIARLNTEQSYFQYKDSMQEMVRGVIEAYWNLVQARTDAWARKIQVEQSKEAFELELARKKAGFGDDSNVAQSRVTYQQFRANKIAADATVLTREGALRNILGLPPEDNRQIVPVSAPTSRLLNPDWKKLINLAEQRRPDIVELKLIVEADRQRLLQAENQALPRVNATVSYQWNGLSGTMPNGETESTAPGQYGNWTAGINFSVPLGLRTERAKVRQQKLIIDRDLTNVEQGVHAAIHDLAETVRDLAGAYAQYQAFKETREAADLNVDVQIKRFEAGKSIYLTVLQALNDWGTAVSTEAQQLLTYNIALATLERQTGTILETHGLVFVEEQFRAAGPLMIPGHGPMYPAAQVPVGSPKLYPATNEPSENAFDLKTPVRPDLKLPEKLPQAELP